MRVKRLRQSGFGDEALVRANAKDFLVKVEQLVDWSLIDAELGSMYSDSDQPSHPPLVLFKMILLAYWHLLSDAQCAEECLDRISYRRFLGLSLTDTVPDETGVARFRLRLAERHLMPQMMMRLNDQLEEWREEWASAGRRLARLR